MGAETGAFSLSPVADAGGQTPLAADGAGSVASFRHSFNCGCGGFGKTV